MTAKGFDVQLAGVDLRVVPGSYRKRAAPMFGSRFATGNPDYSNLSFWQHHAQASWIGGLDAPLWTDNAMFDKAVGVDTTMPDGMRLARELVSCVMPTGGANDIRFFIVAGDYVYCVQGFGTTVSNFATKIWRLVPGATYGAGSWVLELDMTNLRATYGTVYSLGNDFVLVLVGLARTGKTNMSTVIVASNGTLSGEVNVLMPATSPLAATPSVFWANELTVAVHRDIASGGTFTLSVAGGTTSAIAWNASAATVDTAVTTAGGIACTVTGTGTVADPWVIIFATPPVSVTINGASLTVTVTRLVANTNVMGQPYTLGLFCFVPFGRYIWQFTTAATWNGTTPFWTWNDLHGAEVVAAELDFGQLYWLSKDGHLARTDGAAIQEVWRFDPGVYGVSLKSYDGRLYIGTYESDGTVASVGEGVIYQLAGGALTQLKRWGKVNRATVIGAMATHDRKLYYSAGGLFGFQDGLGVAVYDSTEDAHSIYATNSDIATYPDATGKGVDWIVDALFFHGGYMFVAVRRYGIFRTAVRVRDIEQGLARFDISKAGSDLVSLSGGWLISSDFDAGAPGLSKMWRSITIRADLPDSDCGVLAECSLDGGVQWYVAGELTKMMGRTFTQRTFVLPQWTSTRLRWRLTLRSTHSETSPKVTFVLVSYVPLPEPNWMWSFSAVIADSVEGQNGETLTMDVNVVRSVLEVAWRSGTLVAFTDLDGTQWATGGGTGVLMYDMSEDVVSPSLPLECRVHVTLIEGVEQYS